MNYDEDLQDFEESENDINNLSEDEAKDMLIGYIENEPKLLAKIKILKSQIKKLKKK